MEILKGLACILFGCLFIIGFLFLIAKPLALILLCVLITLVVVGIGAAFIILGVEKLENNT